MSSKTSASSGSDKEMKQQGCMLEEFKEAKEVHSLISSLINIYKDQIAVETTYERCLLIIDNYQEQPHLIDPHLEAILGQLLDIIRDVTSPTEVVNLAFKLLYLITKTRGYKVIVRLMPHEVADLEPVLALLNQQDKSDFKTWETRYMLLLWLSIVSMIPFDMTRLDSNLRSQTGEIKQPIMERIVDAGKRYLDVSDKSRDAAAYMLSRFMTRPDVKKEKLPEFLDWAVLTIQSSGLELMSSQRVVTGILATIALLFKHGKREDLVPYASVLLEKVTSLGLAESSNNVLRKLHMKLTQRIGLAFLRTKVAPWRYQRGCRSLADNLTSTKSDLSNMTSGQEEQEEEYDIPEEMEDVIEYLLKGLKDSVTMVRWSAAKGVGRITGRLPRELADEVVESLMMLFTITETDGAWHGGCLALAELGRRGLLLPERLADVVPVVLKALAYDEKRGHCSVGVHVRDAACYVCWAFARAYEPQDLEPYVTQIATALLTASVFDREVVVRRAAAAAFQENVGRQGQFPHGIDILTTCDYFAVGNINHCYLELSVFVAQFPEYTVALINHLSEVKVAHWSPAMRELAAHGLCNLTARAPTYVAEKVLPSVLERCSSVDLNDRHGALIMTAFIMIGLAHTISDTETDVSKLIGPACTEEIRCLTQKLHEAKLFRGGGGEQMRKAVCCLIDKLSEARMPYHNDPIIGIWQEMIDECLHYPDPEVQKAAIDAIPNFYSQYYQQADGTAKPGIQEKILTNCLKCLNSSVETVRMGYALALGQLPQFMLRGKLDQIIEALDVTSRVSNKDKFTEARRDAILALNSLCVTAGLDLSGSPKDVLCNSNISLLYDILFAAMSDYTLDNRGDVGAWVREASMTGLQTLTSLLVQSDVQLITENRIENLFCCLIQQSCEKIDRTRAHAGEIFKALLYHKPEIPYIPHREELLRIFPWKDVENMNWAVPAATFPRFTELLSYPTYSYSVLLGLCVSVGGLTESLVRFSSFSLISYMRQKVTTSDAVNAFGASILKISTDHRKQDRVMIPLLKMLDQLLSIGCFDVLTADPDPSFAIELSQHCTEEVKRSADPQKLLAAVDVFCDLLHFKGNVRKKTLSQLLIFLCHRYPIVRKNVAGKLYETMLTYEDIVEEEHLDEVMGILSETQWDEPVAEIRPVRNQLCELFKVPVPVPKKSGTTGAPPGGAVKAT